MITHYRWSKNLTFNKGFYEHFPIVKYLFVKLQDDMYMYVKKISEEYLLYERSGESFLHWLDWWGWGVSEIILKF